MSPEKQGVFLAFERSEFSKNSGILQLVRKGHFKVSTADVIQNI
jgi:hypothetical protein